ncbi:MAG: hypothetical protein HUU34_14465 [Saprospiraceae bacterium]|jgi:hypothetical protein|nr:hypothetical protein [Saprospiraceae bacterium]
MFKYTKHNLKKLESLFEELQYTVRYEKGNFQSGYCILENKKVVVINKFYETEGRINCLLEILGTIAYTPDKLSEASQKLIKQMDNPNTTDEEEIESTTVHPS